MARHCCGTTRAGHHFQQVVRGQEQLVEQRSESVGDGNAEQQHQHRFHPKQEPVAVEKAALPDAQAPHHAGRQRNHQRVGIDRRVRRAVLASLVVTAKQDSRHQRVNETGDDGKQGEAQHHGYGLVARFGGCEFHCPRVRIHMVFRQTTVGGEAAMW